MCTTIAGVNEGELSTLLRDHASRYEVPGAALGVLDHGEVTTVCHGLADVRTERPVTPETRFSAGSLTKPMVATVIARLATAGRLSFDDPVSRYVPELRGGWAEVATVRDLLANRSGLPLREDLEFGFADRTDADDGALSRLVTELDTSVPRSAFWSYTNLGWCSLGRVIETVVGATWEDAMLRELADVGMRETTYTVDDGWVGRATGHAITPGGPVPVEPLVARAYAPAGTSVVTTVADLLRFAAVHLEDPSLATLRTVQAKVPIYGWMDAWCLGWARFEWGGNHVWGWDGLIDGERSFLRLMPERHTAVALVTNSDAGRAMYRSLFIDLMQWLFGIVVPPLTLSPPSGAVADLARYAGLYAWPDRRIEVSVTERGLVMDSGLNRTEAFPLDERTFLVNASDPDNPTMTFGAFDEAGRPGILYEMLWGLPRVEA